MRDQMTRLSLACILCTGLLISGAVAADYTLVWERTFGEFDANESAFSIIENASGSYAFAGSTQLLETEDSDAWVATLTADGEPLWNEPYGGLNMDEARSVIETSDGEYLAVGTTMLLSPSGQWHKNALLLKLSRDGQVVWSETYGDENVNISAYSVIEVSGGGYVFAGNAEAFGTGLTDAIAVGIDTNRDVNWSGTYGLPETNESAFSIIEVPGGDLLFAGTNETTDDPENTDAWVVRISSDGEELGSRSFGGPDADEARAIIQAADENFVFAGTFGARDPAGEPDTDAWAVKIDGGGNEIWNTSYGEEDTDTTASGITQIADGGYFIAGAMASDRPAQDTDGLMVKIDADGEIEWDAAIGGSEDDSLNSVIETTEDTYVFAGTIVCDQDPENLHSNAWVIKLREAPPPLPYPAIAIQKSTNCRDADNPPGPSIAAGKPVTWNYVVHNSGNTPIRNVAVTDNRTGPVTRLICGDRDRDRILDPNECWLFRADGVAIAGQYANLATVTGTPVAPDGSTLDPVSDNDPSHYYGYQPATVGDFVWNDTDGDGIQDPGEPGIEGVSVRLLDAKGFCIRPTKTDEKGYYFFRNLQPGNYSVYFIKPDNFTFTIQNAGSDTNKDSDADPVTGKTTPFSLSEGESRLDLDAGLIFNRTTPDQGNASLGNYVWNDTNQNGVQDADEQGIPDVNITLLGDDTTTVVNATTTGTEGNYTFTNLQQGNYYLRFDLLPPFDTFSPKNNSTDPEEDSDADPMTGLTDLITLNAGESQPDWDAGMYNSSVDVGPENTSAISGDLFYDRNRDGIHNTPEVADHDIGDVEIRLLNANQAVLNNTTATLGMTYQFENLSAGEYYIEFILPLNATFTLKGQGTDTTADSDVDPATGRTDLISLTPGEVRNNLDAGLIESETAARIGGFVWDDMNQNGIDDTEPGVPGTSVRLLGDDTSVVRATITEGSSGFSPGTYLFTFLEPGDYFVEFTPPDGLNFTNKSQDSAVNPDTGRTDLITLLGGDDRMDVNAGLVPAVEPPANGSLQVTSDPNGAAILLDTVQTGQITPYTFDDLTPGDYAVRVELEGYEPAGDVFTVIAGQTTVASFMLNATENEIVPETGSLFVDSQPQGASITLDGILTGEVTPFTFSDLEPGEYQVMAQLEGFETADLTVVVSAGITAEVVFFLEPVEIPGNDTPTPG